MGNNPIRYVDPDGRFQVTADGTLIFLPERYDNGDILYRIYTNKKNGVEYRAINGLLVTNSGSKIKVFYKPDKKISPGDNFDCHGFTFTDGFVWIDNSQVEKILQDDGYQPVRFPSSGDIMIQKNQDGDIIHSAKVIAYDRESNSVYVEEALGNRMFRIDDGKYCKTTKKFYKIDRNYIFFYKRPVNVVVESFSAKYSMEEFNEIWNNQ